MRMLPIFAAFILSGCAAAGPVDAPTALDLQERHAAMKAVAAEQTPTADWAGDYRAGDSLSLRQLTVTNERFLESHQLDIGISSWRAGRVEGTTRDRIVLVAEEGSEDFAPRTVFLCIPWGEQRFLVPIEEMEQFCSDVHAAASIKRYLRTGATESIKKYLGTGDATASPSGTPAVPAPWDQLILAAPIESTIAEVISSRIEPHAFGGRVVSMRVAIAAGSAQGVRKGVIFRFAESRQSGLFRVVDVAPDRCIADYTATLAEREFPPEAGWKVSTRPAQRSALTPPYPEKQGLGPRS